MGGLWVDHLEAATEERVVVLQGGAADDRAALGVDEDADAVRGLDDGVIVGGSLRERQLVGEAEQPPAVTRTRRTGSERPSFRASAAIFRAALSVTAMTSVTGVSISLTGYPTCSSMPSRAPFTDSEKVG